MTRQRQILVTVTYNDLGCIIDTKAEPYEEPNLQPTCNQLAIDTISRQAAIDTIRAMQTYKLFAGDDMRLVDQAGAMTELMMLPPAQPEHRWIPCSERLPEEEKKTYWVCTDAEYQCECRWTNNRFGIGEGEWGWSIFDTPQYTKPIAWMPLPAPYQAERKDE